MTPTTPPHSSRSANPPTPSPSHSHNRDLLVLRSRGRGSRSSSSSSSSICRDIAAPCGNVEKRCHHNPGPEQGPASSSQEQANRTIHLSPRQTCAAFPACAANRHAACLLFCGTLEPPRGALPSDSF